MYQKISIIQISTDLLNEKPRNKKDPKNNIFYLYYIKFRDGSWTEKAK